MGRFASLVDSPLKIEFFKQKYHIPQKVGLRYCSTEQIAIDREGGGGGHHSYDSLYRRRNDPPYG